MIQSDPNPVALSKYLIQSGLYPKKTLIKHSTTVINIVWISISDPVEIFSKSSPIRIRFSIAESGWIAFRITGSCSTRVPTTYLSEMSIGLVLDWTGSGIWEILLILDWIRTVKRFIKLGSRPDLDWVNGKISVIFVIKKLCFVDFFDFIWTWILNFLHFLEYGWTWTEF